MYLAKLALAVLWVWVRLHLDNLWWIITRVPKKDRVTLWSLRYDTYVDKYLPNEGNGYNDHDIT